MAKKTYAEKLLDPRWQQLRLKVFERDNWQCRGCESNDKTLHAHHPVYRPYAEGPWDYDASEIITLCADCHEDQHISLESSHANALLALVRAGYWNAYDMDALSDIFSVLKKSDIDQLFLERIHAD